ncbi:transposase [Allochromatium tepidum]|uniref:transposase n=1 Tax=Allochromatium tepidum TaxID=553982 RepID=UPI001F43FAAD|nr:transposase [Allochromatium tepidum]
MAAIKEVLSDRPRCGAPGEFTPEKTGILQSMASRAAFLQDPPHRIRFVYTPKPCSRLNQVEIRFGILTRRLLKRGRFASTDDLKQRLLEFIDFFNQTLAKPFRRTYIGKPLME